MCTLANPPELATSRDVAPSPRRLVVLPSKTGDIREHFATDRDELVSIATYGRARIFRLIFRGDLASLPEMNLPAGFEVDGAMYQEIDVWRISCRTINKPRVPRRRRKSATILPFLRKEPRG